MKQTQTFSLILIILLLQIRPAALLSDLQKPLALHTGLEEKDIN